MERWGFWLPFTCNGREAGWYFSLEPTACVGAAALVCPHMLGSRTVGIKSHAAKQIDENLVWEKTHLVIPPRVVIGIEASFDGGDLSLTRCSLQSQDANVVLGPSGCAELTRCSPWSLRFATAVPIVPVGLFALV